MVVENVEYEDELNISWLFPMWITNGKSIKEQTHYQADKTEYNVSSVGLRRELVEGIKEKNKSMSDREGPTKAVYTKFKKNVQ